MTFKRPDGELGAANGALAHLGETALSSFSQNRPAARHAAAQFGQVRDELLREHDWNFARRRATIAQDPDQPAGEFKFAYSLPGTCLRVIKLEGALENEWSVEGGETGTEEGEAGAVNFLFTDLASPISIRYTALVGLVAKWDATFLAAFEFALAAKLAPLLGRDDALADAMRANKERIIRRAKRLDARERAGSRMPQRGRFITTRRA